MISFLLSCILELVNPQEYENIFIICILQIFGSGFLFYNTNFVWFYVFEVLYNLFQYFRCSFVEIKYKKYGKELSKRLHRNKDYINFIQRGNFDNLLKITYQYKTCNQNVFENHKVLKNLKVDELIIKNNNDVFQDFRVFKYPNKINFKTKVVRMQGMNHIPKFVKYLSCKTFEMSLNFIEKLENLPYNVEEINANYNSISEIKIYSRRLRKLSLRSNNLRSFKLINNKLVSLDLSHNCLNYADISSDKLKYLNLAGNSFENLPLLKRPNLLNYLNISYNNFVVIPEWFTEIPTLNIMYNPIMFDLNTEVCQAYLRDFYPYHFVNESSPRTIYEDSQNIHNHKIHVSLLKCLQEIEEIYEEKKEEIEEINYKEEIKENMIDQSYQLMKHMCKTTQNYGDLNINFPKTLKTIWYLVRDRENRDDILKIMESEFLDSQGMCYTGFIGRLVNSIMGMNILKSSLEISKTDQIIARYMYVKRKIEKESGEIGENEDKIKLLRDYFIKELEDLGLAKRDIEKWTTPLIT